MTEVASTKTPYQIAKEEVQQALIKSNMANLASAHMSLEEDIIRWQGMIDEARKIQQQIDEMGESGEKSVDKIKGLYQKARDHGCSEGTRLLGRR
jgi:hypothetical protein